MASAAGTAGRAVTAAIVALALLVGVPAALVVLVGNPLPTVLPTVEDVRFAVTNGQIDQWTWIKAMALAGWVTWANIFVSFAVEVVAAVRGRAASTIRGLGGAQWLARKVVAQWAMASAVTLQATSSVAIPLPDLPTFASVDDAGPVTAAPVPTAEPVTDSAPVSGPEVEVGRRDTLWSLAATHLSAGEEWETLRNANVGRAMPDGTVLQPGFTRVEPGWRLIVPGDAAPGAGPDAAGPAADTEPARLQTAPLEGSAGSTAPSGTAAPLAELLGYQHRETGPPSPVAPLGDPPPVPAGIEPIASDDIIGYWSVEQGDSLWKIAEGVCAAVARRPVSEDEIRPFWLRIIDTNEDQLAQTDDPDMVHPGQSLGLVLPTLDSGFASSEVALERLSALDQFVPLDGPANLDTARPGDSAPLPEPDGVRAEIAPDDGGTSTDTGDRAGGPGTGSGGGSSTDGTTLPIVSATNPPTPERSITQPAATAGSPVPDSTITAEPAMTEQVMMSGGPALSASTLSFSLGALGTGVGAGALMLMLRRFRHRAAATRLPGAPTTPDPPETVGEAANGAGGEADGFESRIRPIADTDAARWVAATNRFLTHRVKRHPDRPLPAVIAMRAGSFGVEVLLDEPSTPAEGFVDGSGASPLDPAGSTMLSRPGPSWRLHPDLDLQMVEAEASGVPPFSPALVAIGTTEAGDLLLDLELLDLVGIEGDRTVITEWFRSLAMGLAAATWSQACRVVAIGVDPDLGGLPNVTVPEDPARFVPELASETMSAARAADRTPYESRVTAGDYRPPTIALIGEGHDAAAQYLAESARMAHSGLAVVAATPLASDIRIHLSRSESTMEPAGLIFDPALAAPEAVSGAAALLRRTGGDEPQAPSFGGGKLVENPTAGISAPPPADGMAGGGRGTTGGWRLPLGRAGSASGTAPAADPEVQEWIATVLAQQPIEVSVLTDRPAVTGTADAQPKIEAVIVFLAHQRQVSSDRLRELFWPSSTNRSTFDNAMAAVRRALGTGRDDQPRLTYERRTTRYHVSDEVGCDWARATELMKAAASTSDTTTTIAFLCAALELVKGRPGSDVPARHYSWLRDDHEVYVPMETALVDAAYFLGELAVNNGQAQLARWAAAQGLKVVPGQEALHRIQMRAASMSGDRQGVDSAYRAAVRSAEALSGWEDVQPETAALYAKLTGRDDLAANHSS
jgi:DNA-binding SARP family transcriptional activator